MVEVFDDQKVKKCLFWFMSITVVDIENFIEIVLSFGFDVFD